jgi:uncharacterized RDD family membrane protein YckC
MVAELTSPEHVAFEFPLAGPATRAGAFGVDILLILMPLMLYLLIQDIAIGPLGILGLAVLIQFPYFIFSEVLMSGQTPGKKMCSLRVVSDDGLPINWQQVALRNLLRPVDQFPALYALGVLVMMMGSRWQRIGDLAAGTLVILDRPCLELPPPDGASSAHIPTCILRNSEMRRTVLLYGVKRNRLGKPLALELVRPMLSTLTELGVLAEGDDADSAIMAWYHALTTKVDLG